MKGLRGSFLGFTFNNIHSSVVGITRVSHGKFNEERLIPTLKDLTIENANNDNSYYFGSLYKKREFVVKFCFEAMTEVQLKQISLFWNDSQIHELIFDEYPYKVYQARITGNSTLKHVCFTDDGERVYAGEGSFIFTCDYPYARSRYQYQEDYIADRIHSWVSIQDENILNLDMQVASGIGVASGSISYDLLSKEPSWESPKENSLTSTIEMTDEDFEEWLYSLSITDPSKDEWTDEDYGIGLSTMVLGLEDSNFNNKEEWLESSNIPSNLIYGSYKNNAYKLYNAGDLAMPFQVWFKAPNKGETIEEIVLECGDEHLIFGPINYGISSISGLKDHYIVIDTERSSIEGYSKEKIQTGNVFNKKIKEGDLFLIPTGEQLLTVYGRTTTGIKVSPLKINFHYLYY